MYYYLVQNMKAASFLPDLPFPSAEEAAPRLFLLERAPEQGPAVFRATHANQLTAESVDVSLLDPQRMAPAPELPESVQSALESGTLTAVNLRHPRWQDALNLTVPKSKKKRVHLLAVGDVGGTLLTALKLLGGDCISTIGICDLNANTVARWTAEMGQIAWPWNYDALPQVEAVTSEHLFDCDVFIFAATKAIPPVGSEIRDVRMAQFEANRAMLGTYAQMARRVGFDGLFCQISDPVDHLAREVFLRSNRDETGVYDFAGLLPEQVQGFGLGVMAARAAYYAEKESVPSAPLRVYGPHGQGLVVANSAGADYDEVLSHRLTELTRTANLSVRELGFKPYIAPGLSSAAVSILRLLRGEAHYGAIALGGAYFGCCSRMTRRGVEICREEICGPLLDRIEETHRALREFDYA